MLRTMGWVTLFLFLTLAGMVALEFHVGLQLYQTVRPPFPCDLLKLDRTDGGPLVAIRRSDAADAEPPILVPLPEGRLRLRFHGIRWSGLMAGAGFRDRVKLAGIDAGEGGGTRLDLNGGRDGCFDLVSEIGLLATTAAWTVEVPSLPKDVPQVVRFGDGGPTVAP